MANRKQTKTPEELRAEFLRRRRTGLGGSDVGAIMGVDQYRDSLDIYMDKVSPGEDLDTPAMERGRMLEPVVSQLYELRTGRRLRVGKFRRDREDRFLIGSPDRIIRQIGVKPHAPESHDSSGILEIKTANRFVLKKMKEQGLPESYILQLQHYMGLGGTEWGAFAVLCADPWEFLTFTVEFDQELYDRVRELLRAFWREHVEPQKPPLPKVLDYGDSKEVSADTGITIFEPGKELVQWTKNVELFREAQAMLKLGGEAKEYAKDELKELMTLGLGVYEGAGARIYHKEQKGRKTFMERELRAMQPLDPIAMASLLSKAGLELDDIEVLFENSRLNLDDFVKVGDPFKTFRMYDSREE